MLFKTCAWITKSYARQCSVNLNRHLFNKSSSEDPLKKRIRTTLNYVAATGILALGLTYAAVPLYRVFCQVI